MDLNTSDGRVFEDELPEDMTDADYDEWYGFSCVPGNVGCRVGPPVERCKTLAPDGCREEKT